MPVPEADSPEPEFNRQLRKLVHISGGVPVLLVPLVEPLWEPVTLALGGLYLLLLVPVLLFPEKLVSLFESLVKPGENRSYLTGASIYFLVLGATFLIVPPLAGEHGGAVAALGALMLTFGDGLSALVGTQDSLCWPWNDGKPVLGSLGFMLGVTGVWWVYLALDGASLQPGHLLVMLGAAATGAVIESLPLERTVDDNLIVGLVGIGLALLLVPVVYA